VVADDLDVDEAAQIELLRSKLRHNGKSGLRWNWKTCNAPDRMMDEDEI
jgi:hypothetical protein